MKVFDYFLLTLALYWWVKSTLAYLILVNHPAYGTGLITSRYNFYRGWMLGLAALTILMWRRFG